MVGDDERVFVLAGVILPRLASGSVTGHPFYYVLTTCCGRRAGVCA